MNKTQHHMEQLAVLTMIAYAVGLLVGETLRDELYGPPPTSATTHQTIAPTLTPAQRQWQRSSGLFILLKHQLHLTHRRPCQLARKALQNFACLVRPPLRTPF
jgi:hypothetical protein